MSRCLMGLLALSVSLEALAAPVVVGSKKFTESVVLGELAAQRLEAAGLEARHQRELGGTRVLWEALLQGELDAYPEYSGTLRQELLPEARTEAAVDARLHSLGLERGPSLGFQNTYAIGMREARADALGITKLSQLRAHPALVFGFSNEFLDRADGWPALSRAYGLSPSDVRGLDHDLAYRALMDGDIDLTDLYSTDAEIRAYGLRVLEDDRRHFPEYEAFLLLRADLSPRAKAALATLGGRLDEGEMIGLNARVKLDGEAEGAVAADFLERVMGLAPSYQAESLASRLLRATGQHARLVLVSLALALLLGVPLGVLAAKRQRLGRMVLTVVGLAQTVPSLALLVVMIPLLGIGAAPAIAALFVYSLLPIVRGAHAGLVQLPQELRDSAEALGLEPWAQLRLIELPIALPTLLSGVKTAAVINVGTATLGALIGAGGYGQAILTGIRLADFGLILEGALPAAILAWAVQGLFDALERRITRE